MKELLGIAKNARELSIYKNGILVSQESVSSGSLGTVGDSYIGFDIGAVSEEYYTGKMDDMRIYDFALSQQEVVYFALDGVGTIYQPAKPVFVTFDLHEDDGDIDLLDFGLMSLEWLKR